MASVNDVVETLELPQIANWHVIWYDHHQKHFGRFFK